MIRSSQATANIAIVNTSPTRGLPLAKGRRSIHRVTRTELPCSDTFFAIATSTKPLHYFRRGAPKANVLRNGGNRPRPCLSTTPSCNMSRVAQGDGKLPRVYLNCTFGCHCANAFRSMPAIDQLGPANYASFRVGRRSNMRSHSFEITPDFCSI